MVKITFHMKSFKQLYTL